jgi:hypothetical protein
MRKCQICKKEIKDNKRIKWGQGGKGEIHLDCYTTDKQIDNDTVKRPTDYSGERSPYWDWVRVNSFRDDSGDYIEFPEANPDVLSDDSSYWNVNEEENIENRQEFLKQFATLFNRLTRRQREVMFAIEKHKTEERAAKALNIKQQVVSKTLQIVRKKLLQMGVFSQNQSNK